MGITITPKTRTAVVGRRSYAQVRISTEGHAKLKSLSKTSGHAMSALLDIAVAQMRVTASGK